MTQSLKATISAELINRLKTIPEIKTVEFDRVRLRSDDFMSVECPAIQLIDISEQVEHERSRAKKTWILALELVMKATGDQPLSQVELWDLQYLVERKLWSTPSLGISSVIHLRYQGSQTDLHLMEPYYFVRLDLEVLYYEPLVADS